MAMDHEISQEGGLPRQRVHPQGRPIVLGADLPLQHVRQLGADLPRQHVHPQAHPIVPQPEHLIVPQPGNPRQHNVRQHQTILRVEPGVVVVEVVE